MALEGWKDWWWWSLDVFFDVDVWVALLQVLLVSWSVDDLVDVGQKVLVATEVDRAEL